MASPKYTGPRRMVSQAVLDVLLKAVREAGGDDLKKQPKELTRYIMHCDLHTDYDWILQQAAWFVMQGNAR